RQRSRDRAIRTRRRRRRRRRRQGLRGRSQVDRAPRRRHELRGRRQRRQIVALVIALGARLGLHLGCRRRNRWGRWRSRRRRNGRRGDRHHRRGFGGQLRRTDLLHRNRFHVVERRIRIGSRRLGRRCAGERRLQPRRWRQEELLVWLLLVVRRHELVGG